MQPLFTYFCTNSLNHSQFQEFYLISNPMLYHVGFIPDGDGGGFFSFLQKSNSMLSQDELEVVGLLELQAFIEAKSVQLGEAFVDEDVLCMVSQFAPIVEDQVSHSPGTKMGNNGGSRVVFIAFTQPVGDTYAILFDVDFELLGSGYYQFIGVLMLRPGQALDLKTFPSAILFETVDGFLVL